MTSSLRTPSSRPRQHGSTRHEKGEKDMPLSNEATAATGAASFKEALCDVLCTSQGSWSFVELLRIADKLLASDLERSQTSAHKQGSSRFHSARSLRKEIWAVTEMRHEAARWNSMLVAQLRPPERRPRGVPARKPRKRPAPPAW